MATLPRMNRYTVWCEYTRPDGYYKIMKKGVYTSIEEAQVGLKFALKGGDYVHIITEGKDLNPQIQGHPRTCAQMSTCYGCNDDPLRLYIWAKDAKGHTERLSIKEHQYGPYRIFALPTPAPAAATSYAEKEECKASIDIAKDASDASLAHETHATTPFLADTPPASPDSEDEPVYPAPLTTCIEAQAPFTSSKDSLTPSSSQASSEVISVEVVTVQKGLSGVLAAMLDTTIPIPIKQIVIANAELVKSATTLDLKKINASMPPEDPKPLEEKPCETKAELDNDKEDEDEHDEEEGNDSDFDSNYDGLSMIGIKDGRWGNSLSKRVRLLARKRLLTILRRASNGSEA